MRIIINTSNLHTGGGVQVAYSFINECISFGENEYHVFLCKRLIEQIDQSVFPENFFFYEFHERPSPFLRFHVLKRLHKIENEIKPDCVFSVFGPSYWTPNAPHVLGYAVPHFLYPDSPFFKSLDLISRLKWKSLKMIKKYFLIRNASYFHVETEDSKNRLSKFFQIPLENIAVISNTCNSIYDNQIGQNDRKILPEINHNEFRFVTISAYYGHKNFEILNNLIPILKKNNLGNVRFVLTIDHFVYERIFTEEAKSQIINVGPITITSCPELYSECDAMFLPTLLECFSANYPEAMKMNLPILTSNLPFATEVCGEAALYFDPLDVNSILSKIKIIIQDCELRTELVKKGKFQFNKFSSSYERARKYLEFCNTIIQHK